MPSFVRPGAISGPQRPSRANVKPGEYRVTAYLSVPYTKPTPNVDVETFIGRS